MAKFQTFDRDIKIATAGLSQGAISAALAKFAKDELARTISTGEGTNFYSRFVNGRAGVTEEAVDAPGPILYVFSWWSEIIRFALDTLIASSPRKSGAFANSFIVIVDGQLVTDFSEVSPTSEVIITNFRPYVRKVEVGAMKMSVPHFLFNGARREVSSRFGSSFLSCQDTFLTMGAGIHPSIPYILKGGHAMRIKAWRGRVAAGTAKRSERRFYRRKDLEAGQPITYPALVMNMVQ